MSELTWSRVDGMIIAGNLDPKAVEKFLVAKNVVAGLEWYEATPQMVGIRVAIAGEKVATLPAKATELEPGISLIDLVEALAAEFSAEVMIGDQGIDRLPADSFNLEELESDAAKAAAEDKEPLRVVEIGSAPASAVPLLAAFEGVDIVDFDLAVGKRALVAGLPADRQGWYFGDVPLVTLTVSGDEFQAFLVVDDDPENVVTYNWGMVDLLVPGAAKAADAVALAEEAVGSSADVLAIHDAIPGGDPDLAVQAGKKRGPEAVRDFVSALNLPEAVADFLLGRISIEDLGQLEDAHFHQARGISNALGRSVDIMINERDVKTNMWRGYADLQARKPWLVPAIACADATLGLVLLNASRGRGSKRSWPKRLGLVAGTMFLVDSVGQLALAKYARIRAELDSAEDTVYEK